MRAETKTCTRTNIRITTMRLSHFIGQHTTNTDFIMLPLIYTCLTQQVSSSSISSRSLSNWRRAARALRMSRFKYRRTHRILFYDQKSHGGKPIMPMVFSCPFFSRSFDWWKIPDCLSTLSSRKGRVVIGTSPPHPHPHPSPFPPARNNKTQ